jgi:hypothetical protein
MSDMLVWVRGRSLADQSGPMKENSRETLTDWGLRFPGAGANKRRKPSHAIEAFSPGREKC